MPDDDRQFVGFDFAGMAAEFFGVPRSMDPAVLAMQYAANATTSEMAPARRLAIARDMQQFFRELESKAFAELGAANDNGGR